MQESTSPYICHLFICTKNRNGEKKSCSDGDNPALKALLKEAIHTRNLREKVRVCDASCFGLCSAGPNVMIYPQKVLFSQVSRTDVPAILAKVEELLQQAEEDGRVDIRSS
jgi:(2Fe-2S) ferredoxin